MINMLQNFFNLTLLLLCCLIQNECCTKVTFVNTAIKIARQGEFDPTTTTTITGCITPEIISQQLGQVIVTKIECTGQNVPTLHEKAVSNFPELDSLKLFSSRIKRINENAFFNLPKLAYLDLTSNEIATIDQNAFQNLDLRFLYLRENKLVFLEHGIFANLPNLNTIILDYNELEAFEPEWFTESFKLNRIDITHNYIRTIQRHTLKPFKLLEVIDFSSNHINYIHQEAFDGLEALKHLYLNDNRLKKLDQNVFRSLKNISALWLNGNNLTYVSDKTLKDLENGLLFQITIHTNPWQCGCHARVLKWANKNSVFITTGIECYNEDNPVCVFPSENEDMCLEVREEDLNALFYAAYSFNHACVNEEE